MITSVFSRLIILAFGVLYPAFASFKAVRAKNIQDYVKWMMYWIVFALFTCIETFTDLFLFWLPLYYEIKVLFIFWLLSPNGMNGSQILYRVLVHPLLKRKESKIDDYILHIKQQSYTSIMQFGKKVLHNFTAFIMDIVHLNFRSILYKSIQTSPKNQHVKESNYNHKDSVSFPDILIAPIAGDESNLIKDHKHLSTSDSEKVENDSKQTGKTTKRTRKVRGVGNADKLKSGRARRVKTVTINEEK